MKINEIIQTIKSTSKGEDGLLFKFKEESTADVIKYGDGNKECTGIITTCFASIPVIKKAKELGANLIIAHEALFWNHGDRQDWLKDNEAYKIKKQLLDETGIVVWRNHDYMHSGIKVDGEYKDAIFYGLADHLGWTKYIINDEPIPMNYEFDEPILAKDLAKELIDKLNLNGTRIIGNPNTLIKKATIPMHILGSIDDSITKRVNDENIDCLITMEITDFTTEEYIRDASYAGLNKCIIAIGHFNLEEFGMKYYEKYLPTILKKDIKITYIQSGDAFNYILKENKK